MGYLAPGFVEYRGGLQSGTPHEAARESRHAWARSSEASCSVFVILGFCCSARPKRTIAPSTPPDAESIPPFSTMASTPQYQPPELGLVFLESLGVRRGGERRRRFGGLLIELQLQIEEGFSGLERPRLDRVVHSPEKSGHRRDGRDPFPDGIDGFTPWCLRQCVLQAQRGYYRSPAGPSILAESNNCRHHDGSRNESQRDRSARHAVAPRAQECP